MTARPASSSTPAGLGLLGHRRAAGELGDETSLRLPTSAGSTCSNGARLAAHAGGVQAAPCARRRSCPTYGWSGSGARLSSSSTKCAVSVSRASRSGGEDLAAQLELQVGDDRDEVRVAGALADAVHRALHLRRARLDGDERVGDGALGVVVAVDAERDAPAARRRTSATTRATCAGSDAAVRVAQHDALGAGLGRGARAGAARSRGSSRVAVEEVLGVEDHALALRRRGSATESAIIARFSSRVGAHDASRRAARSTCRRSCRPARSSRRARAARGRRSAATSRRRVIPKAAIVTVLEALALEQREELGLLGVRGREARPRRGGRRARRACARRAASRRRSG